MVMLNQRVMDLRLTFFPGKFYLNANALIQFRCEESLVYLWVRWARPFGYRII